MHRNSIATCVVSTIAAAAVALTGCSSSSGAKHGGTTVSYMTWESNVTNAALDATMAKFEQSSGIHVTREAAPNADYAQKLASLIMAKKAPDFFWCTPAEERNLAAEHLLYDWTSHLDKGDGLQASKFSPGSLDLWRTPDGKVYGIPTMANTYGFFYNKDALDKAGVAVPKAGWTWDDLFADLTALQKSAPSTMPLVTQWQLLDSPQGVSAYSVANGGQPIVDSFVNTKTVHADATLRAGAKRFADAIHAHQMTNPDYDASNAVAKFANGGIPLMFGGQWLQQTIEPNKPHFAWGYAPWPAGTAGSVQPIETNGVCSPASLHDPDAVWKTISYLDGPGFDEAMRQQPVAPIAYEPGSTGYYQALNAGGAAAKSIAQTVQYELNAKQKFITQFIGPWATKAADVVTTSWNPALEGKKNLDAGIDATVSGIQKLLQQ